MRIARTELTDTINDGTHRALTKEGYTRKRWSTVIDGREREAHAEADGQETLINEAFKVGGELAMYPGDENLSASARINCRCTLVAAGIPVDREELLGRAFLRIHSSLEHKFVVSLHKAFLFQRDRILSRL